MCASRLAKTIIFLSILLSVAVSECVSGSSLAAPWNELGRSRIVYFVTNENPIDLEPYRVKCPARRVEIVPLSMISLRVGQIKKDPIIYLINREKRLRCTEEEERLLPYASEAIKPNSLITFMTRDNKRDLRREGAWDVLISAPGSKWLYQALDRFISSNSIPNPPAIREISSLVVISTDGRETAEKWAGPVEHSTDWDYRDAFRLDPSMSFDGFDEMYLIDRDSLGQIPENLLNRLPQGIRDAALNGDVTDLLVQKEQKSPGDRTCWRAAIIAPNREMLDMMMSRYSRLDSIPESLSKEPVKNLTSFKSAAVVARSADRNRADLAPYLDDIAGKITSVISGSTKLKCVNRQDMKEAIYEALQMGQHVELDPSAAEDLASVVNSHLLLVVDLQDVSTISTFKANDPIQASNLYGSFTQPAPSRPRQPELDDRRYGIFGPKKYRGYDDPKYRDDYHEYRDELERWQRAYREWEIRRYEHEQAVQNHDIEWKVSCNVTESAEVTANIRLYSLEKGPGYAPGVVLFSTTINGKCQKTRLHKEDIIVVRGEGRRPGSIRVPPSDPYISDTSIVTEAIERAANEFIRSLHKSALLPGELVNLKPMVAKNEPDEQTKETNPVETANVSITPATPVVSARPVKHKTQQDNDLVQIGVVTCLKVPRPGEETENLKKQAIESAARKMLTVMVMRNPDTNVTLEDIVNSAEVESAGWNAESKEYRVKVKFNGI